jgi:small subunit ribosomal protein S8
MAATDTISDMLTRIRNACMVKHQTTKVPCTRMTKAIAQVLQSEGFIESFEETGEIPQKYKGRNRQPIISTLKRVSKPGLRVYSRKQDIPRVLGGIGIAIVSTSRGVMTDREARSQGVGGEILCYVW